MNCEFFSLICPNCHCPADNSKLLSENLQSENMLIFNTVFCIYSLNGYKGNDKDELLFFFFKSKNISYITSIAPGIRIEATSTIY